MVVEYCAIEGCQGGVKSRGWCDKHYRRWIKYGDTTTVITPQFRGSVLDRFIQRVEYSPYCWIMGGHSDKDGYRFISVGRKKRRAHRVSYELFVGEVGEGLVIDHLCHNPPCVNPLHLRAVTPTVNSRNRKGAPKNTSSGYRGVRWSSVKNKWMTRVKEYDKVFYGKESELYELHIAAYRARLLRGEMLYR